AGKEIPFALSAAPAGCGVEAARSRCHLDLALRLRPSACAQGERRVKKFRSRSAQRPQGAESKRHDCDAISIWPFDSGLRPALRANGCFVARSVTLRANLVFSACVDTVPPPTVEPHPNRQAHRRASSPG